MGPAHLKRASSPPGRRFPHLPALDGLRGVAVAVVVAYHLAPDVVPGGFLGVDVFFVLSGFLITSLLLDESATTGRIDLADFYRRRLRRLAPALLLLVAALCAYAAWEAGPGELRRLREHALWTLGYLANWRFIAEGTTYTDVVVGESPLRHAWSLAIEEQFYVLFPFVVVLLGRLTRWRPPALRRAVLITATVGTITSAAAMTALWQAGRHPSRGYFGTDTRAQALLVGVALGALLVGRPPRRGAVAGAAAWTAPVAAVFLASAVATAGERDAWLQHGGFLVVALAVAVVVAGTERVGWLRSVLSARPIVALGLVSYGLYLWHWPTIVVLDEARTGLDGPVLLALRLAVALAASTASYVLVERPIRRGILGRRLGRVAPLVAPAAIASAVALVLVSSAATTVPPALDADRAPVMAAAHAPAARALSMVMVGDSVAHSLAGGEVDDFPHFEPWTPADSPFDPARVELWSVAKPACSFLAGAMVTDDGEAVDLSGFCHRWRDDLAAALRLRPGAWVLVATANDAFPRRLDGRTIELGTAEHTALVADFLDQVRTVAEAQGARVGLIALPPRTGGAAEALDRGGRREALMRDELQAYADRHPGVALVDLFEAICPGADCRSPSPGFRPEWRYDGLHFDGDGARWVAAWLTERLTSG